MTAKNNIPAGYKNSAVGVIPQEWEVKQIKKICKVDAKSLSAKTSPNYEFEYISLSDVDSDSFNISTSHQIFRTAPSRARRIVSKGDVVISTVRPNLQGFFLAKEDKKDLIASTGFAVLTPTECDSQYLLSCFFSQIVSKQFYSLVVGSNYPAVNSSDVAKLKLAVPPMEEQRKIAEILGVWDEAIEKQSRLIEKLELRKRALTQHLLTGRTRLPGFTTPWQKVKLGEIGKFDKGVGVPKEKIVSEGCKAITYGEIYTKYDYVIKDFASYIDSDTAQTSKQISTGAILFAGSGETLEDIGKCVAFIDNDKAYAGGDIIIFNPSIEVDSLVLSYILNSPIVIAQKRRYGQGHSVVHIYQKDLARIEFELPSLPEQKAIAEVLTTADNEIATHRKKLDALRLQKRGLMQQLLTGKTRVKI